jgi:hypothetical protein
MRSRRGAYHRAVTERERQSIAAGLISAWAADRTPPGRFVVRSGGELILYHEASDVQVREMIRRYFLRDNPSSSSDADDDDDEEEEEEASNVKKGWRPPRRPLGRAKNELPAARNGIAAAAPETMPLRDGDRPQDDAGAATGVMSERDDDDDDDVDDASAAIGSQAYQEVQTIVVPHPHDFINQKGGESSRVESSRVASRRVASDVLD